MSDAVIAGAGAPGAVTAGRLLREARQAQGLHIAALASAIKVVPRKLELLEADRLDELPDATFTRALAQTVCRSLKVDPAPVMALLPPLGGHRLELVGERLNKPFRQRPGRGAGGSGPGFMKVAIWGPVLLLLAAVAIYLVPSGWLSGSASRARAALEAGGAAPVGAGTAADAASNVVVTVSAASDSIVSAAPPVVPSAAASETSSPGDGSATPSTIKAAGPAMAARIEPAAASATAVKLLQVRAGADSWVEVVDARGKALVARLVKAGETVELDGALPLKVRIGNAARTEVVFRGKALALDPFTRDNRARFELK
jgi:cytoskeleton protein RodZ